MNNLSNSAIRELLDPYGFAPDDEICGKIRSYVEILLKWNRKISLTAVTIPEEIVKFHFGESIFALQLAKINGRLADVGSGAGFPGLAIGLGARQVSVDLIEQNAKKSAFLAEACRSLEVTNVEALHSRIEDLPVEEQYDFITARAFGNFSPLIRWSAEHSRAEGTVLLWLGEDDSKELTRFTEFEWLQPKRIPNTKSRMILLGKKKN